MYQNITFNPVYTATPPFEEQVLFTLKPSILSYWALVLAIPATGFFSLCALGLVGAMYNEWYSKPQWARDIAWQFASEAKRSEMRQEMFLGVFLLLFFLVLAYFPIKYIVKSVRQLTGKRIIITNSQIYYINKGKTKAYSIEQVVSYAGDKSGYFKEISYALNTNEIISVENVKTSDIVAANNYINIFFNNIKQEQNDKK